MLALVFSARPFALALALGTLGLAKLLLADHWLLRLLALDWRGLLLMQRLALGPLRLLLALRAQGGACLILRIVIRLERPLRLPLLALGPLLGCGGFFLALGLGLGCGRVLLARGIFLRVGGLAAALLPCRLRGGGVGIFAGLLLGAAGRLFGRRAGIGGQEWLERARLALRFFAVFAFLIGLGVGRGEPILRGGGGRSGFLGFARHRGVRARRLSLEFLPHLLTVGIGHALPAIIHARRAELSRDFPGSDLIFSAGDRRRGDDQVVAFFAGPKVLAWLHVRLADEV